MNGENPFNDGRLRGHWDAVIRAIVTVLALFVAWHAPVAWYWKIVLFLGIMFVIGIIYPAVLMKLAEQRERRLLDRIKPVDPAYEQILELVPEAKIMHEEKREFQARMNAITKAHRENSD